MAYRFLLGISQRETNPLRSRGSVGALEYSSRAVAEARGMKWHGEDAASAADGGRGYTAAPETIFRGGVVDVAAPVDKRSNAGCLPAL